jgi:hypothetical protein
MIRLDFEAACKMATTDLPEGWMIEIHLEKGIGWVDLFQPDGARHDFETAGMRMNDLILKALAVAQTANAVSPAVKTSPSKRVSHSKYRS